MRRAIPTALLLAMLPVIAAGLWRSGMLQQPLWTPLLAHQALAVLLAATLATLLNRFAVPPRWRGWPTTAALLALAAAASFGPGATLAAALGAATCLLLGLAVFGTAPTEPALAAATGLGAVMLTLVGTTIARVPTPLVTLLLPLAALATLAVPARRAALRALLRRPAPPSSWLLHAALQVALLFTLLAAALPERFFDPLVNHLMIPTQALTFGHWTPDPARFALALFPIGADHAFTFAMALGGGPASASGEEAAKLVNPLCLAALLALLHATVRDAAGARIAALSIADYAVLLFATLPITLLLATTAMVELPLALQILAATRLALLLRQAPARPAFLAALAVLLASMAAIKLHGALAAAPIALLALPTVLRHPRTLIAPRLLLVALPALLLGAAQYVDAWVRTGNPVFPLLNDVFRSPLWPPTRFEDARWQHHLDWRLLYRMTFDSRSYLESDNGALGITLVLLLIPGIAATLLTPRKDARTPLACLFVAAAYCAGILPTIQYIRYLYPIIPLLIVVGAQALAALPARLPALATTLATVLAIALAPSAGWVLKTIDVRAAFSPAAAHALLARDVPTRLAVQAIDAIGGPKPRVLFGGEPYAAFLRGTFIFAAWYDHALNAALYAADTPSAIDAALAPTHPDFAIAIPTSPDPIERKVATWAAAHGTRIPLPGPVALWALTPP